MEYYSDIFTERTWTAFRASGAHVTAFSISKRVATDALKPGDRLVCYVRRKFVWVGALEVTSAPYESTETIWGDAAFPIRVNVMPSIVLNLANGVPIDRLSGRLSFLPTPRAANWGSHLQGSPRRMLPADGEVVWDELHAQGLSAGEAEVREPVAKLTRLSHTSAQVLLARCGLEMGCQVWVPKSDRARIARNAPDVGASTLLDRLPIAFGGHADATVANIDVIWFRGPVVVAAFEVEHSTSIYSGLLRMADLATVFPNVGFPFYVVAPDERRAAVRAEIVRPLFARLTPPLATTCRLITYKRLEEFTRAYTPDARRFLDPGIIATIAEGFDQ